MTFQNLEAMTLGSASEPGVANMSDLEEAERWIEAHGGIMEIGEEIYDPDAFAEAPQRLFGSSSS